MAPDKYTKLLGLGEGPRPIDYYMLLGLASHVVDVQAIRHRADEALARLTAHVGGPDNDDALALIAEVGQVLKVLTDPEKKAEYDRPFYQQLWPQFAALEQEVISPGHPLSQSGRCRWIESGLAMGLPWESIRDHIDKVTAQHARPAETAGPAVRVSQWSLKDADRIFRCLAMGVELASEKSPSAYQWLAAEGERHELPPAVQGMIRRWAAGLPPESRRLPLSEDAPEAERKGAFELVVRGALSARVMSPDGDARLTELAIASGLSRQVARQTIELQLQQRGAVRKHGAAALRGYPAGGFPGTPPFEAQMALMEREPRSWRWRRLVAVAVIGLIVAVVVLAILWVLFPDKFEFWESFGEPSRTNWVQDERKAILSRVTNPRDLRLARRALGLGGLQERIDAIRELPADGQRPWMVDALGLIARTDAQTEVRLAAVEQLGEFEYADTHACLAGTIEPGQREEVVQRVGRLLTRERNVMVARSLLGRLTSADYSSATAAAKILGEMTGLELTRGPPLTAQDRSRFAKLVIRWIAESGPPPGSIWEELPPVGDILALSASGTKSQRMIFQRRLVELGHKGNRQAWDRMVELSPLETSEAIRNGLAEHLAAVDTPESVLVQILLIGRVDTKGVRAILANLIKHDAPPGGLSRAATLQGRLAGLFDANGYRSWFAEQFPETAARYPEALAELSESDIFSLAVKLFADSGKPATTAETTFLTLETQRGNFVAASLLVMLLRRDTAVARGGPGKGVIAAIASVPTRQAWFFLVDETARSEHLSADMEQTLLQGALKDHLTPGPRYGDKPFGRYLAWHYYMRLGLKHSDLLADKPFLRYRGIPEAALPVLVPSGPPTSLDQMAAAAERLFRQLTPAEQAADLPHLRNLADMGDEVAAAVVKRLKSTK